MRKCGLWAQSTSTCVYYMYLACTFVHEAIILHKVVTNKIFRALFHKVDKIASGSSFEVVGNVQFIFHECLHIV